MKNPEILAMLTSYGNLQNNALHKKLPPLFHVSPNFYEGTPDLGTIQRHVIANAKHSNGVLGFWLSEDPESCAGFGPHVYEVKLAPHRPLYLSLRDLYKLHEFSRSEDQDVASQIAMYMDLREQFSKEYDVLYITDANTAKGEIGEVVVLNFETIESKTWRFSYDDVEDEQIASAPRS